MDFSVDLIVKTPALIPMSVGLLPGHGTKIPQAMWQKKRKKCLH